MENQPPRLGYRGRYPQMLLNCLFQQITTFTLENRMRTLRIAFCVLLAQLLSQGQSKADLVNDPSFELLPIGTQIGDLGGGSQLFNAVGEWTIDRGFIRGAENGITPLDGTKMLQFDSDLASTDIYQLVDVSSFATAIASQQAQASFSAYLNATAAQDFQIGFLAFDSNALPINVNNSFDSYFLPLTTSDSDPDTWEMQYVQWTIPVNTTYLAVGLSATNSGNSSYADSASLQITSVPEPSTSGLLGLAIAARVLRRTTRTRAPRNTMG